jgi:hypothetical protein
MGLAEPSIPVCSLQLLTFISIFMVTFYLGTGAGLEPTTLDHEPNEFTFFLCPV